MRRASGRGPTPRPKRLFCQCQPAPPLEALSLALLLAGRNSPNCETLPCQSHARPCHSAGSPYDPSTGRCIEELRPCNMSKRLHETALHGVAAAWLFALACCVCCTETTPLLHHHQHHPPPFPKHASCARIKVLTTWQVGRCATTLRGSMRQPCNRR